MNRLRINIIVTSYSRHRDWFHSNLKNNRECALIQGVPEKWKPKFLGGMTQECALIIRIMNGTSTYVTRTPCHKACSNLVEWPIYQCCTSTFSSVITTINHLFIHVIVSKNHLECNWSLPSSIPEPINMPVTCGAHTKFTEESAVLKYQELEKGVKLGRERTTGVLCSLLDRYLKKYCVCFMGNFFPP